MSRDTFVEVRCEECTHVNLVRQVAATLVDPGYPASDTCEECGEALDFEEAEPADLDDYRDEPDYDQVREYGDG